MTPEQFAYWLQGFMEMADPKELNKTQTQQIKDHLKLVFDKKTPDRIHEPERGNPPYSLPGIQWYPRPLTIECDTNIPDPMTTPVCSGTTITTTSTYGPNELPNDFDIQNVVNNMNSYKEDKKYKRIKFPGIKC